MKVALTRQYGNRAAANQRKTRISFARRTTLGKAQTAAPPPRRLSWRRLAATCEGAPGPRIRARLQPCRNASRGKTEVKPDHVGADPLVRPASEASVVSTVLSLLSAGQSSRASLDRTAGGGCPYIERNDRSGVAGRRKTSPGQLSRRCTSQEIRPLGPGVKARCK